MTTVYRVEDSPQKKWYFFETLKDGHTRVFMSFTVSCANGHPRRSRVVYATEFTGRGQHKILPTGRTLVFKCSVCDKENDERFRVEQG